MGGLCITLEMGVICTRVACQVSREDSERSRIKLFCQEDTPKHASTRMDEGRHRMSARHARLSKRTQCGILCTGTPSSGREAPETEGGRTRKHAAGAVPEARPRWSPVPSSQGGHPFLTRQQLHNACPRRPTGRVSSLWVMESDYQQMTLLS